VGENGTRKGEGRKQKDKALKGTIRIGHQIGGRHHEHDAGAVFKGSRKKRKAGQGKKGLKEENKRRKARMV